MPDAPTYPIATLYEMAAIPVEAEERFLAELPAILAEVRRVAAIKGLFDAMFSDELEFNINDGKPTWTDDDLRLCTVTVRMPDGESLIHERPLNSEASS